MMFTVEQYEQLLAENKKLVSETQTLQTEIKYLNEKVKYLLKQLFGSKSEKVDPNQLTLLLNGPELPAAN